MEFIFVYFFVCNPKRDHYGLKYWRFFPEHPKRDQMSEIYTPKRDDEHPRHFHMRGPPPPGKHPCPFAYESRPPGR